MKTPARSRALSDIIEVRLDMGIQTRFMPRRFVLVHDALGHGFVDSGYSFIVSRF